MTPSELRAMADNLQLASPAETADVPASLLYVGEIAALLYALAVELETQQARITALEALVQGLSLGLAAAERRLGTVESPIDGPTTAERIEALERRAYAAALEGGTPDD